MRLEVAARRLRRPGPGPGREGRGYTPSVQRQGDAERRAAGSNRSAVHRGDPGSSRVITIETLPNNSLLFNQGVFRYLFLEDFITTYIQTHINTYGADTYKHEATSGLPCLSGAH